MAMDGVKVMIGAPCGKIPVLDSFYDTFAVLEAPPGSIKQRIIGGSIPANLNKIVASAFEKDCTHVFIIEDDSMFARDTLYKLLAHDKPVVAGICRSRQAPFRPYIYSGVDGGGLVWQDLTPEDTGLIKVAATGMGGILIKREVFEALKKPYFKHTFEGEQEWGQDILFGKSLIDAGIDVYCDLDTVIWHATMCVLGSEKLDGEWSTVVKINNATLHI